MFWIVVVIQAFVSAGLCAYLAEEKHRGSGAWFVAGLLLGVFALIACAGLPVKGEGISSRRGELTKKCPDCAEQVKIEARICRSCGRRFEDRDRIISRLEKLIEREAGTALATDAAALLEELAAASGDGRPTPM